MKGFDPIAFVKDDGLIIPEIGTWGLQKYKLMGAYCDIFTSGMRKQWEQLIYIDLFSGAGYAKLKQDGRIIKTSTLIATSIPNKFTKYIVGEFEGDKINALKQRAELCNNGVNIEYIQGDSNKNINRIIDAIPKENNALRFCFVDPFSLNLEFETIKKVAAIGRVDFLILLALQMDGKRNFHNYIRDESEKIDKFLGNNNWRDPFKRGEIHQKDFMKFLADTYDNNMKNLGYVVDPVLKYEVKNDEANVPLYYLAFYSKSKKGNDFYKKIEKYQSPQQKLF